MYKIIKVHSDGTEDYVKSILTGKPLEVHTKELAKAYLLHKGYKQSDVDSVFKFEGYDEPFYEEQPNNYKRDIKYLK